MTSVGYKCDDDDDIVADICGVVSNCHQDYVGNPNLPTEVITQIISYCFWPVCLNVRNVSSLLKAIVDRNKTDGQFNVDQYVKLNPTATIDEQTNYLLNNCGKVFNGLVINESDIFCESLKLVSAVTMLADEQNLQIIKYKRIGGTDREVEHRLCQLGDQFVNLTVLEIDSFISQVIDVTQLTQLKGSLVRFTNCRTNLTKLIFANCNIGSVNAMNDFKEMLAIAAPTLQWLELIRLSYCIIRVPETMLELSMPNLSVLKLIVPQQNHYQISIDISDSIYLHTLETNTYNLIKIATVDSLMLPITSLTISNDNGRVIPFLHEYSNQILELVNYLTIVGDRSSLDWLRSLPWYCLQEVQVLVVRFNNYRVIKQFDVFGIGNFVSSVSSLKRVDFSDCVIRDDALLSLLIIIKNRDTDLVLIFKCVHHCSYDNIIESLTSLFPSTVSSEECPKITLKVLEESILGTEGAESDLNLMKKELVVEIVAGCGIVII